MVPALLHFVTEKISNNGTTDSSQETVASLLAKVVTCDAPNQASAEAPLALRSVGIMRGVRIRRSLLLRVVRVVRGLILVSLIIATGLLCWSAIV